MEPISSSPLDPSIQEDSEVQESENQEDSVDLFETEVESSEIEIVISEILDFTESETDLENYQAFERLKRRLESFNQRELPEKLSARLKLAKELILRISRIKFLIKDSKNAIDKAKTALINITKSLEDMEHGIDQNALKREKVTRILPLVSRLVDIRNRILSEHAKEIQKHSDLAGALKAINHILDQIDVVDIATARTLHGLHLEGDLPVAYERIVETTVREFHPLSVLDNAGEKISLRAYETLKEQSNATQKNHPKSSQQVKPVAKIKFEPKNLEKKDSSVYLMAINIKTTEEVFELIKKDILFYTRETDYNSWHTVVDFIDFFHTFNPPIKSVDAFRKFDPHAQRVHEFSDSCSTRSIAIVGHLSKKYNLQGYPIVQREGRLGIPIHAATIIPCRDGILLIETLNRKQPIVAVRPGVKAKAEMFGDQCTLEIDSTEGPYSKLVRRGELKLPDGSIKFFKTEFPLEEQSISAVMLRYIKDHYEYALVSKKLDYSILVNMHEGKIVFRKGKGKEIKRQTLEFKDLDSSKMDKLLDKYYQKIAMSKSRVKQLLRKFADNQAVLKDISRTPNPVPI